MRRACSTVVLTFWMVVAACGKSPSAPGSSQSGAIPTSGPPVIALRVDGPARIAPGETVAYTATATYGNGVTKDVSGDAAWTPGSPSLAMHFTSPGVAVGIHPGEVFVFANIGAVQGSMSVLVLERGTFKLAGTINEASGRPLPGMSIDVLSGIGSGLHATTNWQGAYVLYGVAGTTQLRVSGDGFITQTRDLVVSSDVVAENFGLAPKQPPATDISGNWTMTLTPSSSCFSPPPDIGNGRTYQVEIVQYGTGLSFSVSGPTVTAYSQQANSGVLFGTRAKLIFVGDTDYGDWSSGDIIDQLSPNEQMQFDGVVEGDVQGLEITATMNGDITYYDSRSTSFAPTWYCRARDHRVTMRK